MIIAFHKTQNIRTIGLFNFFITLSLILCLSQPLIAADSNLTSALTLNFYQQGLVHQILFQAKQGVAPYSLYVTGPGTKIRQLTHDMFAVLPSVPLNGKTVFFETAQNYDSQTLYQIARLDISTLETTCISDHSALDSLPVASPDGKTIAFCSKQLNEKNNNWRIFLMDSNGNNRRALDDPWNGENQLSPEWSPNGNQIIYVHKTVKSTLKSGKMELSPVHKFKCYDFTTRTTLFCLPTDLIVDTPKWSPTGKEIAFVSYDTVQKESSLWIARIEPLTFFQVTKGPMDMQPSWGPEGQKIIFTRKAPNKTAICIVDVKSGKTTELFSSTKATLDHPKIIPDVSPITYPSQASHRFINTEG